MGVLVDLASYKLHSEPISQQKSCYVKVIYLCMVHLYVYHIYIFVPVPVYWCQCAQRTCHFSFPLDGFICSIMFCWQLQLDGVICCSNSAMFPPSTLLFFF